MSHVGVVGGAEKSLLDLVDALDRDAVDLRAVVPPQGELAAALEGRGVATHTCAGLRRLHRSGPVHRRWAERIQFARGAWEVARILRRRPPRILHANTTTAALFSVAAARRLRVPLVWHLRDLVPLGRWGRTLGNAAARIVIPSACAAPLTEGFGERVVHVPNGIATDDFARPDRPALREELSLGPGPIVLSVGQLVPWKGHDLLAAAAAEVHRIRPDARFLVVGSDRFGDGRGESSVRARIHELGLDGVVRLLGHRDDVPRLLAGADVFVHAAFPEPFGRAVVEAMASALPVVALAGAHGPAEIVRDGVDGRLVQPGEPAELARALVELMDDPGLARAMGTAGRERAREHYDRRLVGLRCARLYRELVS